MLKSSADVDHAFAKCYEGLQVRDFVGLLGLKVCWGYGTARLPQIPEIEQRELEAKDRS